MPPKQPLRLVIDTNILVSALFSIVRRRESIERTLFDLIVSSERLNLLVSPSILDEYDEVFHRPHFAFGAQADAAMTALRRFGWHLEPTAKIEALRDPDDTKFLAAALDGKAHYLITRNKRDFPDWVFIVTVKEFLKLEYPELLSG